MRIKKVLKFELYLFCAFFLIATLVIYKDYNSRPGLVNADTLQISDRTTDTVSLKWKPVRNVDKYIVSYKPSDSTEWTDIEVSGDKHNIEINELEEGKEYLFELKADSTEKKGHTSDNVSASTKKHQNIQGKTKQMKLANSKVDLNLDSETDVKIESKDENVIKVKDDQTIEVVNPGTVTVTATAEENDEFVEDSIEVELEVLDSVYEETSDASIHTIYKLDNSNCEVVKTVTGTKSADVPQSFGFTGDDYIIAYGMHDTQRIVSFNIESGEKSVSNPKIALGHPNGFAYSDETKKCYCVKGWGGRCVVYTPETDEYDVFELPYGASGIAYDRINKQFYTSSRNIMVSYSPDFEVLKTVAAVKHKGTYYTQDCGGHSGIMLRCLSDKSKHGINLIDLYDMVNGKYLGTIECNLSEVESAVVDNDGYMELLCNTTDDKDYIWKTPINVDELGAELVQVSQEQEKEQTSLEQKNEEKQ